MHPKDLIGPDLTAHDDALAVGKLRILNCNVPEVGVSDT